MKELLHAAALALSTLGSLFTNVDAPKAQASSLKPQATVVAAPPRAMPAETPGNAKAREPAKSFVVVFGRRDGHGPLDEQVTLRIRQSPSVKAAVADEPWYLAMRRNLGSSTVPSQRCETTVAWIADRAL